MMDTGVRDGDTDAPVPEPDAWVGAAYDGEPESIAAGRHVAGDFLERLQREQGIPVPLDVVGAVKLVVSELITNACKYAPGPCSLNLERVGRLVKITVWDSCIALPLARAAEPGRVGQHGLEIVMALCEGFEVRREPVGKRITVRVALTPATL